MTERDGGIDVQVEGGVGTVWLNRPDKLNALNREMIDGLISAFDALAFDSTCRVVLCRGRGRAFSAGADLRQAGATNYLSHQSWTGAMLRALTRPQQSSKPVVAAIHGYALGAGCTLALACDVVIAEENAIVGFPELTHGLVAGVSLAYLQRAVSTQVAMDLLLSGEQLTASRAHELQIVSRVIGAQDFETSVAGYVAHIAGLDSDALSVTKRLAYGAADLPFRSAVLTGADGVLVGRLARAPHNVEMRER